jgi:hypothetical protein
MTEQERENGRTEELRVVELDLLQNSLSEAQRSAPKEGLS